MGYGQGFSMSGPSVMKTKSYLSVFFVLFLNRCSIDQYIVGDLENTAAVCFYCACVKNVQNK